MASDYRVETQCPICGETKALYVPLDGYLKWEQGTLIQDAMPTLSANDRERLITGICPDCWDNVLGD